jgi:hypothetical protein
MKNISVIAFNSFGLGLRKLYTWGVNVYMLGLAAIYWAI